MYRGRLNDLRPFCDYLFLFYNVYLLFGESIVNRSWVAKGTLCKSVII